MNNFRVRAQILLLALTIGLAEQAAHNHNRKVRILQIWLLINFFFEGEGRRERSWWSLQSSGPSPRRGGAWLGLRPRGHPRLQEGGGGVWWAWSFWNKFLVDLLFENDCTMWPDDRLEGIGIRSGLGITSYRIISIISSSENNEDKDR